MSKAARLTIDARKSEILSALKSRIAEAGLTQADIAAACGWQQPLVSDYLTGKKDPGLENLIKLATALDCQWQLRSVHE